MKKMKEKKVNESDDEDNDSIPPPRDEGENMLHNSYTTI